MNSSLHDRHNRHDRFQVVVIDCPYDTISEGFTQRMFARFLAAKMDGYKKAYPKDVLPFGSYDFVGTLVLLCEKTPDHDLLPVAVFKSLTADRCERFNLPFEALTIFPLPEHDIYRRAITEAARAAKVAGGTVAYNSSWTIHPRVRSNPEMKGIVAEVFPSLLFHHYMSVGMSGVLSAGIIRFKVDQLQKWMGFDDLYVDGQKLPPHACDFVFGELTALMLARRWSDEFAAQSAPYRALWEKRITMAALDDDSAGMNVAQAA
jgi:hypothetical protein